MISITKQHIVVVDGVGGPKPSIIGHRVRVQDVAIWHEKLGMTPDAIVDQYPGLTLADVYAALSYYWDHREELDHLIAEEQTLVEQLRRGHVGPLQHKLQG